MKKKHRLSFIKNSNGSLYIYVNTKVSGFEHGVYNVFVQTSCKWIRFFFSLSLFRLYREFQWLSIIYYYYYYIKQTKRANKRKFDYKFFAIFKTAKPKALNIFIIYGHVIVCLDRKQLKFDIKSRLFSSSSSIVIRTISMVVCVFSSISFSVYFAPKKIIPTITNIFLTFYFHLNTVK